jgi:hypothetical protein
MIYLSQSSVPRDVNAFDDLLVSFLQSEELQTDMESARDLMLEYVQQRMGDGAEGGRESYEDIGDDDYGYQQG